MAMTRFKLLDYIYDREEPLRIKDEDINKLGFGLSVESTKSPGGRPGAWW